MAAISSMNTWIATITAGGLVFFALLFIVARSPTASEGAMAAVGAQEIVTAAGAAAAGVLVSLVGIHTKLDHCFVGARHAIGSMIAHGLSQPCATAACTRHRDLGVFTSEIPPLTSTFLSNLVPSDDTDREHAFVLWGRYYATLNLLFVAVVLALPGLHLATVASEPHQRVSAIIIAASPLLMLPILVGRYRALGIPTKSQIARIRAFEGEKLRALLPTQREYIQGKLRCADSGLCPLMERDHG